MLPRSQRLSTGQFKAVMEKGRITHSPLFLVRSVAVPGQTHIAAVIPAKIGKTAVTRTNGRRRIYAAVEKLASSLKPGMQAIIFAKQPLEKLEYAALAAEIKAVLAKAGVLK